MWIGSGIGSSAPAGSATTLVASLSAGALLLRPFTILRSRMLVSWINDQSATSQTTFGVFAKLVVTDQAVAAGASAIPNPSGIDGNPDSDWFVWQAMIDDFIFKSASGFQSRVGQAHYVIDSKAMRKVGPNEDVVTMVDVQGVDGLLLITHGRTLIQLH